jgi:hypothetical protein
MEQTTFTLSKEEKVELLKQFNANEKMKEAVKQVLLAGIYENGVIKEGQKHNPMLNWAMSLVFNADDRLTNEQLGAKLSALAEGIRFVESAFDKISDYKDAKPASTGKNQAR